MDAVTITAIGGLWKLGVVLLLFVLVFIYRKQLPELLNVSSLRWKWGSAEAELRRPESITQDKTLGSSQATATLPAPATESPTPADDLTVQEKDTPLSDFHAMIRAFLLRDAKAAEESFEKTQAAESDPVLKLNSRARYLYLRFEWLADPQALPELEKLSNDPQARAGANYWMGRTYEHIGSFEKAVTFYETAVEAARNEEQRSTAVIAAARCIARSDTEKGISRITQEIEKTTDKALLKSYYEELGEIYKRSGNHALRAAAYEKVLELVPNDTDALFTAAFSFQETDFPGIAALRYKNLIGFSPKNAGALNNLGVAYQDLDMPMHSIRVYHQSAELGETLAMANLAYKYMNAGFEEEASKILAEAKTKDEVHANVGSAIAALDKKKEQETKNADRVLEGARQAQIFLQAFGDAYFSTDDKCPSFSGKWSSDQFELQIEEKQNRKLEGTWIPKPTLFGQEEKLTLTGEVNNRGATIEIKKGTSLISPTVERGYAYLSPDGRDCHILTTKDKEHTVRHLTKT